MTRMMFAIAIAAALLILSACKSTHEEGVKSDLHAQWLTVNASTEASTNAARAVLQAEDLKDVQASSTKVDGRASAKKADGTKIEVGIKRKTDTSSEVSVVVGTLGEPAFGAELARKIKDRAEGNK